MYYVLYGCLVLFGMYKVEQCRHLAETLISSYPDCDTPGLIQAAQYVRQKNTGQAIECLKVSYELWVFCVIHLYPEYSENIR